jgi:hypothetical protein
MAKNAPAGPVKLGAIFVTMFAFTKPGVGEKGIADHERHAELSLEALRIERVAAIHLRDAGRIDDQVLRPSYRRELDLTESRITTTRDTRPAR